MRNKLSPYYDILNESRLKEHQNWEDLFLPDPPSTAPKEKTKTCEFCGEPISSGKLCGQCKFMLMNNPDSSFARKHPELLESLYRTGLEPLPGDQVDLNSTEMAPLDKHGVDIRAGGLEYDKDPNKEFKFPLYGPTGERQPESFKSALRATRLRESADIDDVEEFEAPSMPEDLAITFVRQLNDQPEEGPRGVALALKRVAKQTRKSVQDVINDLDIMHQRDKAFQSFAYAILAVSTDESLADKLSIWAKTFRVLKESDIEDVSDYNSRSHAQGEVGEKVYVQSAIRPDLHFEGVILRKTPKMHPDQKTEFFTIGDDEGNVLYKNVPLDDIYALNEAKSSPFHVGDRVLIKIPADELDVYGDWNGLKGTIVGDLSNPKDFYRTQIWRDPQFQGLVVEPDEDQDGGNLRISPAWLRHLRSKKRESVDDMDLDDYEEPAGMVGQKIKVQVPWDDLTDAPNTIAQEYDKGEGVIKKIVGNRVLADIWDTHYNDWVEVMFPRRWIQVLHESEVEDVSDYEVTSRYDLALRALQDQGIDALVNRDSRNEIYIEVRNLPTAKGGFSLIREILKKLGLAVWREYSENTFIPGEGWGINSVFDLKDSASNPVQESVLEPTLGDMRKGNLQNNAPQKTETPIPPPPEAADVSEFDEPGYSPDEQHILDTYLQYYPQMGNAQAISKVSDDLHVPYAAVFAIVSAYENKFNADVYEQENPQGETEEIIPQGFFEAGRVFTVGTKPPKMGIENADVDELDDFDVPGRDVVRQVRDNSKEYRKQILHVLRAIGFNLLYQDRRVNGYRYKFSSYLTSGDRLPEGKTAIEYLKDVVHGFGWDKKYGVVASSTKYYPAIFVPFIHNPEA